MTFMPIKCTELMLRRAEREKQGEGRQMCGGGEQKDADERGGGADQKGNGESGRRSSRRGVCEDKKMTAKGRCW